MRNQQRRRTVSMEKMVWHLLYFEKNVNKRKNMCK